jgi:hypothetical protein
MIDPKVAGDESFPIGPKEGLKGDATHHSLVLTAPVVGDQFYLPGTLSKVVPSNRSPCPRSTSASCHNASVSGGFRAGEYLLSSNEKVDVI